jgi:enamine deaminase RidA (YjgF/YER057c/UK114 family)
VGSDGLRRINPSSGDKVNPSYDNPRKHKHRSDSVVWNGIVYVSGVLAQGGRDFAQQVRQVLEELDLRLQAAGTDKSNLLSATIFLADVNRDVATLNPIWSDWLAPGCLPARACVQATLQGEGLLEVTAIAAVRQK